jgi:tetratricopeptide (TPR) repeat protein
LIVRENHMKRTERHHLKEDGIVTGLSRVVQFVRKWERELLIAVGVVTVAALIFGALLVLRSRQLNSQSRKAGEILELAADLDANPDNLAKLESLARKGRFTRIGTIELAKHWLGKSDFEKADSVLSEFPKSPRDLLYYQAENLKAQSAILQKDFETAIAIYLKIEEDNPDAYPLDAVLFHLAEAYELKGDTKEARGLYERIQLEYTQTYYGYEASVKAGRLQLEK